MNRKIFIDLHHLRNTKKGFGQYNLHLAKGIVKNNLNNFNITFYVPLTWLFKFGSKVNYKAYFGFHRKRHNIKGYDIWHNLTHLSKIKPRDTKNTKLINTIHDAIFTIINIAEAKVKQELDLMQKRIDESDAIVFISKFTQQCVQNHLNIPPHIKQYVIYNGNPMHGVKPIKSKALDFPYLLCVGEFRKYKNHKALIPMLSYLPEDIKLIFMGKYKADKQKFILDIAKKYNVENRIIFKSKVSEHKKIKLYSNCLALVHPSYAEGYGLPVVEAMSFGKPVIISNNTALPEVGGNAANYWDHYEPNYMANIVKSTLKDYKANKTLKEKELIEQASKFSWEVAATKYLKVYEDILA